VDGVGWQNEERSAGEPTSLFVHARLAHGERNRRCRVIGFVAEDWILWGGCEWSWHRRMTQAGRVGVQRLVERAAAGRIRTRKNAKGQTAGEGRGDLVADHATLRRVGQPTQRHRPERCG
jgi:hypothetical protein